MLNSLEHQKQSVYTGQLFFLPISSSFHPKLVEKKKQKKTRQQEHIVWYGSAGNLAE